MPFITVLEVRPIRGTNIRRLLADLIFADKKLGRIVAPSGTMTDYSSIPTIIPRWFIDQDEYFIRDSSVIHDYLYSTFSSYDLSRKGCDQIFYRAMLSLCANKWDRFRSYIVYKIVRLVGKKYYKIEGRHQV